MIIFVKTARHLIRRLANKGLVSKSLHLPPSDDRKNADEEERNMSGKWKALLIVALLGVEAPAGNALVAHRNLAAGDQQVKQLLLLMDENKNGKVSKQEFMHFMEEEFARLDVNKDGELDVKELTQLSVQPRYKPPRR
jgi:hypothetical protein